MLLKFNFRFVLFMVLCFCIYGFSSAKTNLKQATSDIDTADKKRTLKTKDAKTSSQAVSGKSSNIEMPAIIVKEDPSQKSSFLLPSPEKEEKPFSPVKRRKAIRHKANEIYSKEALADKINVDSAANSYLPDRARASITRSMHQIVVEKEKGLKPKIEYKSVKYVMMPEESGNEIQTTSSKTDTRLKDLDFSPSVSKFLIKRKYLIGSLNGKTADNKGIQVIVDGHTVMSDKYLTSTADPIGYKQKSDQKSVNALEEVKLMKTRPSEKMYYKELDSTKQKKEKKSKMKSTKIEFKQEKYRREMKKEENVKKSPITKYDKMTMKEKLIYSQQFNEKKPSESVQKEYNIKKTKVKAVKSKAKSQKTEVFVTRRKSIRPKHKDSKYMSQNAPINIEVDTKDWKSNYHRKKDNLMQSMLESKPVLTGKKHKDNDVTFGKKHKEYTISVERKSNEHIVSMGKKSKEQNIPVKLNKKDTSLFEKETLYGSNPINIKIDTKDWKTNYSKKKNKLLQAMLDSSTYEKGQFKGGKSKAKTIKEVVQQRKVHSFLIKPNTVIEVGNTEITVGVPSHVAMKSLATERKSKGKIMKELKTELKPPATLKAFRSDEVKRKIDTATFSNAEKSDRRGSTKEKTTTASPQSIKTLRSTKQPSTTTQFPLKIEFVTEKIPPELKSTRNKSSLVKKKKKKKHKKFITNGLSEDSKKSRIITSSENLNVNLDHYADFTRTGITNGENNIVVGTLSGIKDRANAGMINLQVDTAEREQVLNVTKSTKSNRNGRHSPTNAKVSSAKTVPFSHITISTKSQSQSSLSNVVKKQDKSMTDFSISLLAAHEVEKTTPAPLKKKKSTTKAPAKKSPRFVIRNNNSSGKSFVFSFKTNKKPKVNVPKVASVQFQPAFIYKDTAEIHRSENSLFANSIHEKSEKTPNTFYKHSILREKHKDFRWPVPSKRVQGIPVTQPPPEVSTLGLIISGDFVSSFAEQAFKDVSSAKKVSKQFNKTTAKANLQPKQTIKNDFLFPVQSFYTPSPRAITTVDLALVTKRRNGLYQNDKYYSIDLHNQIQELLNSTETNQLTDIPGNIDIPTSTVPLPKLPNNFIPNRPKIMPFVYTAESQAGKTKMQRINNKPNWKNQLERTTLGNSAPASITGFDIGLSLNRDKSKKTLVQMTQATQAFKETSQSPMKKVVNGGSSLSNFRMKIPSKPIETVIYPTVSVGTDRKFVTEKPSLPKSISTTTTTTTTTTTPRPETTSKTTTTTTISNPTTVASTTNKPTIPSTTTTEKTTTTTSASIKEVISDLSSLNQIAKKAKDALQRISEVFKGPPDNIIAVSKTDAFKKYKKAATEVIEIKKSPTMVPAVGIIKPLRKSEAIYKFSQYGSKRNHEMNEENAIKREIKKLLIQQNTIYPAPLQNGKVLHQRVTPMMDQNMYTQNEITSNARGMLYNTPEMTSMMIATESMAPEQNSGYIQNYNFPGANRQALGNSARYPFQNSVRVTPPMPIVQPQVYQPSGGRGQHHRMSWTTVLPNGSTMDEFAIVKDDEMVIFLVSDQTPPQSTLDKSSTLLDFTVGHMAMRFNIDGTNGQMCFVTHTSAKFQNTKEALQNRALSQVVRLADPIQLYAELTTHVPQHDLNRVGGKAFYKFCKIAIKQDNVYELVMEPTGNIGPRSFTGSGLVYPSEPGLSVPITINVESMINLKRKRF